MWNSHEDKEKWIATLNPNYLLINELKNVFVCLLGSDGCYPAYWGYNAHNEIVCLVIDVLYFDSNYHIPFWPDWKYPAPPDDFNQEFIHWLDQFDEFSRANPPLPRDDIDFLISLAKCTPPADLLLYYEHKHPWTDPVGFSTSTWKKIFLKELNEKNRTVFPLLIWDDEDYIAVQVFNNNAYTVFHNQGYYAGSGNNSGGYWPGKS